MLSAFKNFAVTLVISLVIFGLAAYFASTFVTDTMNSILSSEKEQLGSIIEAPSDDDPIDDPVNPIDPDDLIEGESFSLLLVITDYRPDLYGDYIPATLPTDNGEEETTEPRDSLGYLSADYREAGASAIVLVCADKEGEKYTYTYFSPESRMNTPAGYHTLGEAYSYYGEAVLAEHIHALTGIMPTYQMTVNGYNLDEVAELLGTVYVSLSRNIYFDGKEYTTQYEQTREAVDEDGETYTEHIPNELVLYEGGVALDAENIYILSSLSERSMADINAKESYTVEAVKQYLAKLSAMGEEELALVVSLLTLNESQWGDLGDFGDAEVDVPPSEDNPWWSAESGVTPAETEVETEAEIETETEAETLSADETAEETEKEPEETVYLFEPDTPILETGFSALDLNSIGSVLRAHPEFTHTTVSYPGSYVNATEDHGAYLDLNTQVGLQKFLPIRASMLEKGEK